MHGFLEQLGTGSAADDLIGELFPFHIVLDLADSPTILSTGKTLQIWVKQDFAGKPFLDCFRILRPAIAAFNSEGLRAKKDAVFVLEVEGRVAQLRGQVVVGEGDRAVFLGSPVLSTSTKVEDLGLSLADFAPHDATVDLIVLQRFSEMQLADLKDQAAELNEAQKARDRLSESASTDPLTGLANRRAFWSRCGEELDRPHRLSLLFVDVDRFKAVNDLYGHGVGDVVLRRMAYRLEQAVRPVDLVARLGGDEFAILLAGVNEQETGLIVERIQRAMIEPIEVDGQVCQTSVSIGVVHRSGNETVDDLIQDADAAMYEGRQLGPGRITWFADRMRVEREERRNLTEDLEVAIDSGSLGPVFQPIVNLEDRTITSCEALARWTHAEHGVIPPDRFVELAEGSALIDRLDDLILGRSLEAVLAWQAIAPNVGLQVNVSGRSIGPTLATRMDEALTLIGVDPHLLTIEVTESWLIQNEKEVANALHDVAGLGVHIHLDDFGTGYSSLAHIHALPISGLKIDRSFVGQALQSERSRRLIAATIGMAHSLELDVIAEGVEDEETAALLLELGCDFGQGFLFARPGSIDDLAAVVNHGSTHRYAEGLFAPSR